MELVFRPATLADIPALREITGDEPSAEQIGVSGGDVNKARRFRALAMASVAGPGGVPRTTVAVAGDDVVGLLQAGPEVGERVTPSLAWGVIRIFGPLGVGGFLRRDRIRAKVYLAPPPGTYHIAELHVSSARRNLGIGAGLLAEGERQARAAGFPAMSLTTTTDNPARHLYERFGFVLAETSTDPAYLALTGIDGRVLMVKPLG